MGSSSWRLHLVWRGGEFEIARAVLRWGERKGEVGLEWGKRALREVKNCRRDGLDRKRGVPEAGRRLFAVPLIMWPSCACFFSSLSSG